MEKEKFAGIFPALMTAFGGDSGIDMYSIARLVEKLRADGVNGLYVGGSSAEMILCSTEERRKILEGVMSASDGLTIIAHIGAASTNDSLELARHAVMCGVDAISSVTPFYYKYRFDDVKHYYERLADVGLPLIIYNIPALTGASYGFDQLCELLEIPGVEGMKFTSSDFYLLNRLAARYPEKVFYNGSDECFSRDLRLARMAESEPPTISCPTYMAAYGRFSAKGGCPRRLKIAADRRSRDLRRAEIRLGRRKQADDRILRRTVRNLPRTLFTAR